MKKYVLYLSAISTLVIAGCRKIEMDGEIQVVVVKLQKLEQQQVEKMAALAGNV